MGAAVYDTGDGRVAYEGGGVWTSDADGNSRMVSPPEFHYREETLTLPVVQLDGDVRASGPQVGLVATAGETDRVDISNPLPEDSGSVYVTVGSEFYQAWGRFIAERTDGRVVQFDHDNETVTVELVVPSPVTIENAVYSSGQGSNAVQVQNMDIDSYDTDEYSSSNAKKSGDVVTDGGISPIEGTIDGDVYTVRNGKKIKMTSGGRVNGNVHSQKRVVVDSGVVEESIFAEDAVEFKGQEVGKSVHADGKVTLGSSGLTVGDEVRTTGDLSFGSSGVTIDGDVHAAKLKSLGQSPDLNGDVYTSGFYGERGNRVGVSLSGELHAGDGIYTDGTEIDGAAYTDGDFEDTDSVYGGEVHVGGDADLSGTEVSKTVYVAGDAELGSATINDEIHVGGDITCPEDNTVTGSVKVDGTVAESCSFDDGGSPNLGKLTSPDDPKPPKSPDEPTPDPPKIEVPPEDEIDPVPDDAGCTNGGTIQVGSSDEHCELPPGTYKVSKLDIDQGDLTFTGDGKVELYVEGDVSLSGSGGTVTTAPGGEHDATRVEINVIGDSTVDIQGMSFTGVINAPKSTVDMDEDNGVGAEVFGAVVAETVQGDNGAQIHYDEDLSGQTVGDGKNGTTSVQYLHVTRNEMTVED
jgi:cytoskeletal protein CcmA (bactofilin family)